MQLDGTGIILFHVRNAGRLAGHLLVPWEPWGGVVSLSKPLFLGPGAGTVHHDLLHGVLASHTGSRQGWPRQSWLDGLLVGRLRVATAICG